MSKSAFIFPGQGSQSVGMGVALADHFSEAKALFREAEKVLGFDLLQICREGPDEKLRETDVAQPALYVTGVIAANVLMSQGVGAPDATAGHSVGEYAALAAADVFSFSEGLALVLARGRLMKTAGHARAGTMAAVLGLGKEALQAVCAEAAQEDVCLPVNFNSPEQIVVAGDRRAMERFAVLAPQKGAKRVILLNVAGAFHSPLMKNAAQEMASSLGKVIFRAPRCPIAMNVDGVLRSDAKEIQEALCRQLDHSVEWVRTIESMKAAGITQFIECGAGRVLSGLLRRIDAGLRAFSTESVEAVRETVKALELERRQPL